MIRVLVADDQAIVRDGLVTLLDLADDIDVVGAASDGEEAVRLVADAHPDVVLMDLRMPNVDGVEATRRIRERFPGTAVLVLTTYADDESIGGALRAGARGYLTKDTGRAELAAAVRAVAAGQSTFAREVGERLIGGFSAPPPAGGLRERFPALTPREIDVLDAMTQGHNNAAIAAELFLSVATVKSYVNTLFAKLGARDRAHAIAIALGRDS
ncbi:response regulator transcription factor [Cryptosporangium phraense]|uniref:Response regulator transcription factor n=1 Tax=Cryptosporangium phraense TaxID=2593070 RepID=A0A545AMS6_9ACTN|nr:response regulator transcription factor [Cryptosporangium phraense]TQS42644.1 response regulator transcription factor [Cryptosporangium phraense]